MAHAPLCPRPGHDTDDYRVVRDGIQHSPLRPRQRWRCIGPDGEYHRFLGVMSHTHATANYCLECDRPIASYEGPAAPWRFDYLVREIASSLVEIGNGSSYTETAQRVRAQAWGPTREWSRSRSTVVNGALVAEWLHQFGPVVAADYREAEWPATLVFDSTEFQHTDSYTGVQSQLFCVLFAYGYPNDGTAPRMWRIASSPRDGGDSWAKFLAELPGTPEVVICDGDASIRKGVDLLWARRGVRVYSCEHHLYVNARKAFTKDGITGSDPLHQLLNVAFHSQREWAAFEAAAQSGDTPALARWTTKTGKKIGKQLEWRNTVQVHSNGAIEGPIQTVRDELQRRAWCFRNRERMDLLLEMMRLRINRVSSADTYATAIREHLRVTGGMPTAPRKVWDPAGAASLRA